MENITIEAAQVLETKEDARVMADKLGIKYSGNTGLDTLKGKIVNVLQAEAETNTSLFDGVTTQPDAPVTTEETTESVANTANIADTPVVSSDPAVVVPSAEELAAKAKAEAEEKARLIAQAEAEERAEAAKIQVAQHPVKKPKFTTAELLEMDANAVEDVVLRRQIIRAKGLRLRRVRIQNLDPSEANVPGNIITVYNKYLGKVSKYVPNNSDEPYHVPEVIYNHLKSKKFVLRKEIPGSKFGIKKYKTVMVRKYSIEDLPPLTEEELEALAKQQVASGSIED